MKDSLVAGISTTAKILVDRDRTIGFMGDEGRVYATPWMVRDIEHTARDLLIEHLPLIQDHYGHLSARHLAALADDMRLAQTEVYEVATFYAHFDVVREDETPPPPLTVRVCDSLTCEMMGAMGLEKTDDLKPWHLMRRTEAYEIRNYSEIYDFLKPGDLLKKSLPISYARAVEAANAESFNDIHPSV